MILNILTSDKTKSHKNNLEIKKSRCFKKDTKSCPCIMLATLKSLVQTNNLRRQTRNIKQIRGREQNKTIKTGTGGFVG